MITYPNAKINLGLYVTERRSDGYHNLETVFYPIPLCDTLEIVIEESPEKSDEIFTVHMADYTLQTEGIAIDSEPEKNLVVKALRNLKRDFNIPRVKIRLKKNIPSGAGLGGGSSDAAFTLKMLNEMFGLSISDDELEQRAATLGADCAFFIRNHATFATGIGNIFEPVSLNLKDWYFVLVKPDVFVSTKEAYAQITPHKPIYRLTDVITQSLDSWKDMMSNDFEPGIFNLYPSVGNIKQTLYDMGAVYASMSGSGSSVFGIFADEPVLTDGQFGDAFCYVGRW